MLRYPFFIIQFNRKGFTQMTIKLKVGRSYLMRQNGRKQCAAHIRPIGPHRLGGMICERVRGLFIGEQSHLSITATTGRFGAMANVQVRRTPIGLIAIGNRFRLTDSAAARLIVSELPQYDYEVAVMRILNVG